MRSGHWAVLFMGSIFGVAVGCSSGGDGNVATAYINKLDACGLLSDGERPSVDPGAVDDEAKCYVNCLLVASCEDVTVFTCGGFDPDVEPSAELLGCLQSCEGGGEGGTFTCTDGASIPSSWECDGEPDCDDGSDEVSCPTFTCADGSGEIPPSWECDGEPDCDDGSDELGCPTFTCTDGSGTIPADWQCDGGTDCDDGSDEQGCPGFVDCADGNGSVPDGAVCDGFPQCGDGSDEQGCPTYTCADGQQVVGGARCDLSQDCEDGSDEDGCAQLVCPMP